MHTDTGFCFVLLLCFLFVCFAGLMLISDTDRYIILTPFGQCSFPRVSYVFKILDYLKKKHGCFFLGVESLGRIVFLAKVLELESLEIS